MSRSVQPVQKKTPYSHHGFHFSTVLAAIVRGLSEKFSASTLGGNTIGKIFFLSWYICHKHPCEIASHSIK